MDAPAGTGGYRTWAGVVICTMTREVMVALSAMCEATLPVASHMRDLRVDYAILTVVTEAALVRRAGDPPTVRR